FCESSPCQNGGVCSQVEGGHTCVCPKEFSGRNCEFFGVDCDSSPCQGDGLCHSLEHGGYQCECPPGTAGIHCEVDSYNECESN
ncbi:calcium-binding EGF-like domain-containing protein, partial [Staphylococcus aureus]|nr:calcium-binding EGF-like domain-containing protein [Staphylococcus aureus]